MIVVDRTAADFVVAVCVGFVHSSVEFGVEVSFDFLEQEIWAAVVVKHFVGLGMTKRATEAATKS